MNIESDEITVRFEYGGRSYIPAEKIQPMLEDLAALANTFESSEE